RKPAPPPPAPAASEEIGREMTLTGTVMVVGRAPYEKVMVLPVDPRLAGVEARGEWREEIRAASGARITVEGSIVEPGRMRVARYTIVSVDGKPALIGVLESRDGGLYLNVKGEGESRQVRIEPIPEGLSGRAGAKVWVVLGADGAVEAYGILREPGS
ncbi:MAG: hypothetical protein ACREKI_02190, partial [Gemmatimonadota bacterium]